VEIKVRGYNLTLRKHEAEQIFVKTPAASHA
jgi:Fe2+ transport system protein FeoA